MCSTVAFGDIVGRYINIRLIAILTCFLFLFVIPTFIPLYCKDCRNDYESQLGNFLNAIPLNTSKFSESWEKLDEILEAVPKSKKILTYCTGNLSSSENF